ncbi:hypothetical protein BN2497_13561 [Janthinobacterium sp. CG23_2]|nr:hypothetical protein BN2497_13561 [Janthinobacterium sp. CG23_2]CUU33178.1 hypothetical protein BN3177_13561 [Janthinobacterium sp. CG23_2]
MSLLQAFLGNDASPVYVQLLHTVTHIHADRATQIAELLPLSTSMPRIWLTVSINCEKKKLHNALR